jgi:LmbE family N-acetylglucosaminyl deacetylase
MPDLKIMIIAAHPDDEILGCGGTISRLTKEGKTALTLVLGGGITARRPISQKDSSSAEVEALKKQALKANKIVGVRKVIMYDFPDNRFDQVPLLEIVKIIEKVKNEFKPDIVFTHYEKDLNIDHRITYQAAITASRPLPGETIKEIYSFEVLSSTQCNYPLSFSPDTFFNIDKTIKNKIQALRLYRSELRGFPNPRSIEGVKISARFWGMWVGLHYAEAFKAIRIIK